MTFAIQQYELHMSVVTVEAETEGEAIAKWMDGEGEVVDDSSEYLELAAGYGQPIPPETLEELKRVKPDADPWLPGFRQISRDEDDRGGGDCADETARGGLLVDGPEDRS